MGVMRRFFQGDPGVPGPPGPKGDQGQDGKTVAIVLDEMELARVIQNSNPNPSQLTKGARGPGPDHRRAARAVIAHLKEGS